MVVRTVSEVTRSTSDEAGDTRHLLAGVADYAADYLGGLDARPVGPRTTDVGEVRARFPSSLPDGPSAAHVVLDELISAATPAIVNSQSARYFGFVIGGSTPAALAADWVTSTWDQNAVMFSTSPAAAVLEEIVGAWTKELLGLPAGASFGSVTGTQMAHVTALAAARQHVLARVGWDAQARGLAGAPRIAVLASEDRHVTIDRAVRLLGLGSESFVAVATDDEGRTDPSALAHALARVGAPAIVCLQAGDVNSGAFDDFELLIDAARSAGAWVHVDGAFGLWAAASPGHRRLLRGAEKADSWATDMHKWLNVPYDSGLVFIAQPEQHRAAMALDATYLTTASGGARDPMEWTPELSRRARGVAAYAALRSLGRAGLAELVGRCCACAQRFAAIFDASAGCRVINEVVLNQVLVRFGEDDDVTDEVIRRVQTDGTCWVSGSTWRHRRVMRISVCNWRTTLDDVERSADAILAAYQSSKPADRRSAHG